MVFLIVTILMASIPEGKCILKSALMPDNVIFITQNGGKMWMPLSLSTSEFNAVVPSKISQDQRYTHHNYKYILPHYEH